MVCSLLSPRVGRGEGIAGQKRVVWDGLGSGGGRAAAEVAEASALPGLRSLYGLLGSTPAK